MTTRSVNVLRYGTPEDLPEEISLRAGPLTVRYMDGDLRTIRLGSREVLRRVYVAVRDHNWNTIPATLSNVRISQNEQSFEIGYTATHTEGDICFSWDAVITGAPDGKITFAMDGAACSTFMRNRIGFCVLHPMDECAGQLCRVTHTDGRVTESRFPWFISPHQPFKEIRTIAHQVTPAVWAHVRMEGEVFEMEDQRNWTDASFKTYSTPLSLPFPVRIDEGTPVRQSVTLHLEGATREQDTEEIAKPPALTLGGVIRDQLPPIGLGMSSRSDDLSPKAVDALHKLELAHLRVDLSGEDVASDLARADEQATTLGIGLEIGIPLARLNEERLGQLIKALSGLSSSVTRYLLFNDGLDASEAQRTLSDVHPSLKRVSPSAQFAVGSNAYFTELNRNRPPLDHADALCYSLNPQVHAFDNLSLVETLPAQAVTVESAQQIGRGRGIVVSPITLRPRFNPNATAEEQSAEPGELPDAVDPRQMSLFGAGWTLGSLKYLMGHPGVDSLTYYETVGWRGVMGHPQGSPSPKFVSQAEEVFPLYHVLRWVAQHRSAAIRALCSDAPQLVEGLALEEDDTLYVSVANLSNVPQTCTLINVNVPVRVVIIDEANVESAMGDPDFIEATGGEQVTPTQGRLELTLAPCAVAWLEPLIG